MGVTHSAVVTRSGELFTGGSKVDGQLGVKFSQNYSSLNLMNQSSQETSVLKSYRDSQKLQQMSSAINKVPFFGPENPAISVKCGDSFSVVLSLDQKVYTFGKGSHGKLGLGLEVQNLQD